MQPFNVVNVSKVQHRKKWFLKKKNLIIKPICTNLFYVITNLSSVDVSVFLPFSFVNFLLAGVRALLLSPFSCGQQEIRRLVFQFHIRGARLCKIVFFFYYNDNNKRGK